MTVQAHAADRRLVVLAVLGVVLALTAAMWTLAGCAPKAETDAPAESGQKAEGSGSGSGAAASSVRMASIMRSTSLSSCSGLLNISCAVGTLRRCSASYCSSAAHSSAGAA